MGNRHKTLLWMKDLIEHMNRCHDQLQYAGDGPAAMFLTERMLGDLNQCLRLCENLRAPGLEEERTPARRPAAEAHGTARCA